MKITNFNLQNPELKGIKFLILCKNESEYKRILSSKLLEVGRIVSHRFKPCSGFDSYCISVIDGEAKSTGTLGYGYNQKEFDGLVVDANTFLNQNDKMFMFTVNSSNVRLMKSFYEDLEELGFDLSNPGDAKTRTWKRIRHNGDGSKFHQGPGRPTSYEKLYISSEAHLGDEEGTVFNLPEQYNEALEFAKKGIEFWNKARTVEILIGKKKTEVIISNKKRIEVAGELISIDQVHGLIDFMTKEPGKLKSPWVISVDSVSIGCTMGITKGELFEIVEAYEELNGK